MTYHQTLYVCPQCEVVWQKAPVNGTEERYPDFPRFGKEEKVCEQCATAHSPLTWEAE